MKNYLSIIASMFIGLSGFSQNGIIKGDIKTEDGSSAGFSSVVIKNTNKETISNKDGYYELQNIEPGDYTLVVTLSDFKTEEKNVTLQPNESLTLNFILTSTPNELQTVEVTGRKKASYKNDKSFSASKVEMRIVDIPQSISSVTKEFIQDKQALRLNDIVQNVAGINQFSNYDDITMRGFRNSGSNGRLINGLRSVNTYFTSPLLVNIEKVEFIKGPASATFSNTNPGGTINMITKKPLDEARQSVQFSTGSFNALRTQADFTGPLDKEKTLLYRLNVGVEDADSYRNNMFNKSLVIAPSISFLPQEGTRFNADFVYTKGHTQFDEGRPIVDGSEDVFALPMGLSVSQPTDYVQQQSMALTLSFSQQLTKKLNFNASYLRINYKDHFTEHGVDSYVTPDVVQLYYYDAIDKQYANNLTTYLNYVTDTGSIKHNILVGYDYVDGGTEQYARQATGTDDNVGDFNLLQPDYKRRDLENYIFRDANSANYGTEYNTNGFYIQDILKYKRFQLMLSLRKEYYTYPKSKDLSLIGTLENKQTQNALLPKVGLTYAVTDDVNVYATYTTGFEAQDSSTITSPGAGGPFDPLESSLYEAGAKGEFFKKRLFGGLAVYQILQNNVLVNANDPVNPNLLKQRGQERSRGVELEAGGYILPNLSIQLSYAYNNAVITKSNEGDTDNQVGLSKEGAPKNVSGSWIKYSIKSGDFNGLGFGFGHSQVSSSETYSRTLVIPSYLIFNAATYYKVKRFQIALNLNNLTNEKYLVGGFRYSRTFPGAPFNYMASVGYTF